LAQEKTMTGTFLSALMLAAGTLPAEGVPAPAVAGVNVPGIKVDTVGYEAGWKKSAVLSAYQPSQGSVAVVDLDKGTRWALPKDALMSFGADGASGESPWRADFSALTATGRYRLEIGQGRSLADTSDAFRVGTGLYARALLASQKMFYYQRTRTKLEEPYTLWEEGDDDYTRAAPSHVHANVGWTLDSYPAKKRKWPLVKGWHDAGNFDMYIPSTAPSCQLLMQAYEAAPTRFGDANGIPESGNGIPDILDETVWGLDWVLCMQTADGSFRVREAVMKLGEVGNGPADKDQSTRWVSGIASASTAKACAALAQAARVVKPFDRKRSEAYGRAAAKAWSWLKAHPERVELSVPDSDQPLWDDGPEYKDENGARAAAAFELWHSFRLKDALADLRARWRQPQLGAGALEGGWPNIGRFAVLGLAQDAESPQDLRDEAKRRLFQAVDGYRAQVEEDGYRCLLKTGEYYWGSPCVLMEKAALLSLAARLDPVGHGWAVDVVRDQWHWVLGRNPNGYSLISRVGKGPTRIYHLEWGKKTAPPPGYLVDGPNHSNAAFLSPKAPAKALLWFSPQNLRSGVKAGDPWHNDQEDLWEGGFIPANTWSVGWWVVTEVDLYYNAALVLAAAGLGD
jgi:endoglucanase